MGRENVWRGFGVLCHSSGWYVRRYDVCVGVCEVNVRCVCHHMAAWCVCVCKMCVK